MFPTVDQARLSSAQWGVIIFYCAKRAFFLQLLGEWFVRSWYSLSFHHPKWVKKVLFCRYCMQNSLVAKWHFSGLNVVNRVRLSKRRKHSVSITWRVTNFYKQVHIIFTVLRLFNLGFLFFLFYKRFSWKLCFLLCCWIVYCRFLSILVLFG